MLGKLFQYKTRMSKVVSHPGTEDTVMQGKHFATVVIWGAAYL